MQLPEDLLEREITRILEQYRATPEQVRAIFLDVFGKNKQLLRNIHDRHPQEDVTRWRDYKAAVKDVRKRVYYALRQYHQGADETTALGEQLAAAVDLTNDLTDVRAITRQILETHVSTRERHPYLAALYEQLFAAVGTPEHIVDIGCGINPISFPYYAPYTPVIYAAIDKDPRSITLLNTFSKIWTPLHPRQQDIRACAFSDRDTPDLILMLKVIPVIQRQAHDLLPILAKLPGRYMCITASSVAMTKNVAIQRREDRVLRDFIAATGREVCATIEIPNEFGYILG
jgi:16S rRNA (guanine(1405)-N(7))-methyltransferase